MYEVQWIKANTDMFDNVKIQKMLRKRDGDSFFRVWIQLLVLAGKSNDHGAILLGENLPMSIEDLAKTVHKTIPKLTEIIQFLCENNMIIIEDNVIYIKNWEKYQNADKLEQIRENGRKRTQKCRERKKNCNVTETFSNNQEKNREEQIEKRIEIGTHENESGFKVDRLY